MSIGVWEPDKPVTIELAQLRHWLEVYRQGDPENLAAGLSDDEIQADATVTKLDEGAWQAAEQLNCEEIGDLVRFFTLAETQLPNWQGGETSPVIYLVKILRARGAFPDTLRKWIKRHTDNRYLPYGPAL
ncbi:MAG: hypothetical protein WD356_07075 [Pseudomonadales bacterium]